MALADGSELELHGSMASSPCPAAGVDPARIDGDDVSPSGDGIAPSVIQPRVQPRALAELLLGLPPADVHAVLSMAHALECSPEGEDAHLVLPSWWETPAHDLGLLQGLRDHLHVATSAQPQQPQWWRVWGDPKLPFRSLAASVGAEINWLDFFPTDGACAALLRRYDLAAQASQERAAFAQSHG